MRRLLWTIFTIPFGVVIVALAVANRHSVELILDPFAPSDPALAVDVPLYVILFGAMLVGILLGGFATWVGQGKWRRTARTRGREAAAWRHKADQFARHAAATARPHGETPAIEARPSH